MQIQLENNEVLHISDEEVFYLAVNKDSTPLLIDEKDGLETINQLIAEKVMDWEKDDSQHWRNEEGLNTSFMQYPPHPAWANCSNRYFRPTTKIEHAWLVIEKLQKEWSWDMVMHNEAEEVEVRIGKGNYVSRSTPFAICMSALKLIGIVQKQI